MLWGFGNYFAVSHSIKTRTTRNSEIFHISGEFRVDLYYQFKDPCSITLWSITPTHQLTSNIMKPSFAADAYRANTPPKKNFVSWLKNFLINLINNVTMIYWKISKLFQQEAWWHGWWFITQWNLCFLNDDFCKSSRGISLPLHLWRIQYILSHTAQNN